MELIIALLLDLFFGEAHNTVHPVVWTGKLINGLDNRLPRTIIAGLFCVVCVCSVGFLVSIGIYHIGLLMFVLVPYLLKATFSITSLYTHVKRCDTDDIEKLRRSASMIVSRDTSALTKEELYSAAIESLAENFVDGVISPFFYYMLFGLPGALVCRCVNTMDAMIGYRTEKYEKFGKVAARLDDILNFIPARLSVLIFAVVSPTKCIRSAFKYGGIKINGTWSIACISGILDIRLRKRGVYDINPNCKLPQRQNLQKTLKMYWVIAVFTVGLTLLIFFLIDHSFIFTFRYRGIF